MRIDLLLRTLCALGLILAGPGRIEGTQPQFVDATEQSGIRFPPVKLPLEGLALPDVKGSGAAWGDYDGDGDFDLYIPRHAPFRLSRKTPDHSTNVLYRNNGDGTFSDVTQHAGVGHNGSGRGASWADFDGDGDLDLFVTNLGQNVLYRNNADGTFTDVTSSVGVAGGAKDWSTASTWADFDGDGDLDLYVCNYVNVFAPPDKLPGFHHDHHQVPLERLPQAFAPQANLLYRNDGQGRFTETGREMGVDNPEGRSLAATFADLDNDGWVDLLVGNDVSDNRLYQNRRGRFHDVSRQTGVLDPRGSMGLTIGDYNNDGHLDFFLTYWYLQENALYENMTSAVGRLLFTDVADSTRLGPISSARVGWGTDLFDYDNDGWLDILVVNGHTFDQPGEPVRLIPQPFFLFRNSGRGHFEEATTSAGAVLSQAIVGRGAAFADYDDDGDTDVLVIRWFETPVLLRNDGGNRNAWLQVRLRGPDCNPTALGARIEIQIGTERQIRPIVSNSSFLSQNSSDVHFGLGNSQRVDRLIVRWPGGSRTELKDIGARRRVVIGQDGRVDIAPSDPR